MGTASICELVIHIINNYVANEIKNAIDNSHLFEELNSSSIVTQYSSLLQILKSKQELNSECNKIAKKYTPIIDKNKKLKVYLSDVRTVVQEINYIIASGFCNKLVKEDDLSLKVLLDNGNLLTEAKDYVKKELETYNKSPKCFVAFPDYSKKLISELEFEINNVDYKYEVDRVIVVKNNTVIDEKGSNRTPYTDAIIAKVNNLFYMYDSSKFICEKNIYETFDLNKFFFEGVTLHAVVLYKKLTKQK